MKRLAVTLVFALAACREGPPSTHIEKPTAPVNTTVSLPDANSKQDAEPMDRLCAFVLEPPRTLGALETALGVQLRDPPEHEHWTGTVILPVQSDDAGVSSDVDRLLIRYVWDIHHEEPVSSIIALRARELTDYTVHFARGREGCEATLRAAHGAPRVKVNSSGTIPYSYRQYGPFFVATRDGEAFALEWHRTLPDWAVDPIDPAARKAALEGLARSLGTATSTDEVAAVVAALPRSAGIVAKGSLNPGDYWIDLVPSMAAVELGSTLGMTSPVAQSVGVHMASWRIVVTTKPGEWSSLRLGRWMIEPTLAAAPSGGPVAGAPSGPTARRALGPKDTVQTLRLSLIPPR